MKEKIISVLVMFTMLISSTQIAFAAEANIETPMDSETIYSTVDDLNTNGLDEEVLGNTIVTMQEIGFDVVDIGKSQNGVEVSTEVEGVEQDIVITEATDEMVSVNIESNGLTNEICLLDDGRMVIDGNEITSTQEIINESDVSIGDLESNGRIVSYRTSPSYGKSSDYITHHTTKRVISLGEKCIYAFTLGAFLMLMGKEMLAAGFIGAGVEAWGVVSLNTVLGVLIAYNPYTTAFSMKDVVGYHRIKGKTISPVLTVVKHCTTFYSSKYYSYPTGPSKTFFEESWLSVGI
jgi:hypothetical protein